MFTHLVSKITVLFALYTGLIVTITPTLTYAQGFKLLSTSYKSKYLQHPRGIYVYTPANFQQLKLTNTFPVIYFNDGQNLYDPERSVFGKTWELEKTLNTLIKQKLIPPVIVVAVDNTPGRVFEYTFSPGTDGNGGGAKFYMEFLTTELIPMIEKRFPVSTDRTLVGSSLGGLLALFGATTHSTHFTRIAALSPSIWWEKRKILTLISKAKELPSVLYVDSGTSGGERPQDILELDKIMEKFFKDKVTYQSIIYPRATHDESSWAKRLPVILQFLYN